MKKKLGAPAHLSTRGRAFWRSVITEYAIDDPAGLELLRRSCEALDRADGAREIVAAEGATFTTRTGEVRAHPAVAIERDARNAQRQLLRELRITDPPADGQISRLGRTS